MFKLFLFFIFFQFGLCSIQEIFLPEALAQDYIEIDSTVASMQGEAVTSYDLQKKSGKDVFSQEDLKNHLLDNVLEKEASARGIAVKPEDIDIYISQIKAQNKISDSQFLAALQKRNLSETEYREQVKDEILKGKTITHLVRNKVNIVDADIQGYLAEHPEMQPELGTVKVNLIKSSSRTELEDLKAKIGTDAKNLRELGVKGFTDLGYLKPADLREDFQNALRGLSQGEISEVIKINNSYVILELAGRIEQPGDADADLKTQIRNIVFREKYKNAIDGVLTDDLLEKHDLEIIKK